MRARQPSIVHPFRGGMPSGKKIPVRDTAPQNSGPSLSPESGCSAPAGYRLELLFPETEIPRSSSPSPEDAAPISPCPLLPETDGTATPSAPPLPSTDQKKELLGDGGSLRGGREPPLCASQRGSLPPSTKSLLQSLTRYRGAQAGRLATRSASAGRKGRSRAWAGVTQRSS